MLKNKVFIKSAYPFSKIFYSGQADRICRFCKKTFCCAKCRDRHVNKVHSNVNADCSLCAFEILPMRQYESVKLNLEDEKLLCHIVNKHLPLHCRLCGNLFESKEDFVSIAACKWFERWHCLTSPIYHEKILKPLSISESDCNGSKFCTPPEIYRKTSTPMFGGQKIGFETPCVPEFNLITPKTNSPANIQVAISKTQTSDTQFFSFLSSASNEETPFRMSKDEQLPRSNSGRKLSIMEEKTTYEEAEKINANVTEISSPVDMDLTMPEGGILQDSLKSDNVREDVVKKVRFSDHQTAAKEFGNVMESCEQTILNKSMEEEEFHDAHNETNAQNAKTTAEDTNDAKNTVNMNNMKDTCIIEEAKSTNDSQTDDKKLSSIQPLENFLSDSQIKIIRDNTKNVKKENQNPEVSNKDVSTAITVNQQDSNRVLMMVLMESNSRELTNDLVPLISSGLKKLQEQLISANCQSSSSAAESAKVCRRSITTMKMSVSSVESYSANSAAMSNHEPLSSSSSFIQSSETSNNRGFLSVVTQAMKNALKSFSGLRISPRSIETTEVIKRREIVEELTSSSQGSSSGISQVRPGKRTREVTEESSKENPIAFMLDIKSPLAKRQRGWYKMVRGRQPISRMRNNRNNLRTSPRGVSAETQVFSQGFLTVGDTVLPLPTRAHQSTE